MSLPKLGVALILCSLVICQGCIESEHPLADPSDAVVMPELIGTWGDASDDHGETWEVASAGKGFPPGIYRLMEVADKSADRKYFFVTVIGGHHYVNVMHFENDKPLKKWDPSLIRHYTFMCMEVEGNRVRLNAFNEKAVKEAKKRGELSFRIVDDPDEDLADLGFELFLDPEDESESEQLASSTKKLRSYLGSHKDVIKGGEIVHVQKR